MILVYLQWGNSMEVEAISQLGVDHSFSSSQRQSVVNEGGHSLQQIGRHRKLISIADNLNSELQKKLPEWLQIGTSYSEGDCFFDTIAQALNQKEGREDYTVTSLRLLCDEYAKDKANSWVQNAVERDGDSWEYYLARLPFTAEEMDAFDRDGTLKGTATWGRLSIEGRMLCEKLGISLHTIEVLEAPVGGAYFMEQYENSQKTVSIEPMDKDVYGYDQKNLVHLVVHRLHFVPLLDKRNRQIESRPDSKSLSDHDHCSATPTKTKPESSADQSKTSKSEVEMLETPKETEQTSQSSSLLLSYTRRYKDDMGRKMLFEAIQDTNLESVTQCIERGVNVHQPIIDKMLPLAFAIQKLCEKSGHKDGHTEIIRLLMKGNATFDVQKPDNVQILQKLFCLSLPNEFPWVDHLYRSDDYYLIIQEILTKYIFKNEDLSNDEKKQAFESFLGQRPKHQRLVLLIKAEEYSDQTLIEYFLSSGVTKYTSRSNETALHLSKTVELTERLIKEGADIDARSRSSETPLLKAFSSSQTIKFDKARLLIEKNADINALNSNNETVLHLALRNCTDPKCLSYLLGNEKMLLDVQSDQGDTALHLGCRQFKLDFIHVLIDAGSDPNVMNKAGRVAIEQLFAPLPSYTREIEEAEQKKDAEIIMNLARRTRKPLDSYIEHLVGHVAIPRDNNYLLDVLYKSGAIDTGLLARCLLKAVESFSKTSKTLNWLLKHDVPINFQNNEGNTPLHLACQRGSLDYVQCLLNAKCDPNLENKARKIAIESLKHIGFRANSDEEKRLDAEIIISLLTKSDKKTLCNLENLLRIACQLDSTVLADALQEHAGKIEEKILSEILSYAAHHKDSTRMFDWLLERVATIDNKNPQCVTDLYSAAQDGNIKIMKRLLAAGADPSLEGRQYGALASTVIEAFIEAIPRLIAPSQEQFKERVSLDVVTDLLFDLVKRLGRGYLLGEKGTQIYYALFSFVLDNKYLYFSLSKFSNYLLELGVKLPTEGHFRVQMIEQACANGDSKLFGKLCTDHGEYTMDNRAIAAVFASRRLRKDVIDQLLTLNLNLNASYHNYNTSNTCTRSTLLECTCIELWNHHREVSLDKIEDFIKYLIDQGASPHFFGVSSSSLLHLGCKYGLNGLVEQLLKPDYGFHINQPDCEGETPLQVAVKNNQVSAARHLLENGANLEVKDKRKMPLLHIAIEQASLEMVRLLIEFGEDPNTAYQGVFIIHPIGTALHLHSQKNDENSLEIIKLLVRSDIEITGSTLFRAFSDQHLDLAHIKQMIQIADKKHALLDACPLHLAAIRGRIDVLAFLIEDYYSQLHNRLNTAGQNALITAIAGNQPEAFDLLIKAGESPGIVDYTNLTPAIYAIMYGRMEEFSHLSWPENIRKSAYEVLFTFLLKEKEFERPHFAVNPEIHKGLCCYKLLILFETAEKAIQYIEKFRNNENYINHPVHNLTLFDLPSPSDKWTPGHWAKLAMEYASEVTQYIQLAPQIEEILEGPPSSLEDVKEAAKKVRYKRSHENPSASRLFHRYRIHENIFNRVLDKHAPKSSERIPDISLNGDKFDAAGFYMQKLSRDDYAGYILGAMTACCQSVGSAGEPCAWYGMQSLNAGFYVIYKRFKQKDIDRAERPYLAIMKANKLDDFLSSFRKEQRKKYEKLCDEKERALGRSASPDRVIEELREDIKEEFEHTKKGEIIAQSLVWIGKNGDFVFDSWERRRPEDERICWPFLEQAAKYLITKKGFKRVLIGKWGQTPESPETRKDVTDPEEPIDYQDYRDSEEQYLIQSAETLVKPPTVAPSAAIGEHELLPKSQAKEANEVYQQLKSKYSSRDDITLLEPIVLEPHSHLVADKSYFDLEHPHVYVQLFSKDDHHFIATLLKLHIPKFPESKPMQEIICITPDGIDHSYFTIRGYFDRVLPNGNDKYTKRAGLAYQFSSDSERRLWMVTQINNLLETDELIILENAVENDL
ncbi:MAG: hypothetical protein K940chlam7_01253 [Chlamydiae bacterium]|nr:hypothetical protein [Chlamydiota bacterium]